MWFQQVGSGERLRRRGGEEQLCYIKLFTVKLLSQLIMTSTQINCLTNFKRKMWQDANVFPQSELMVSDDSSKQIMRWNNLFLVGFIHTEAWHSFHYQSIYCTNIFYYFTAVLNIICNCMVVSCNHVLHDIYRACKNMYER